MKRIQQFMVIVAALLVIGACFDNKVHAQSPQAWTIQGSGLHTTCWTPAVGAYYLCPATDGIWISNNGAAYFQIVPQAAQIGGMSSLTINGVTKTGSAPSFTLTTPSTVTAQ